MIPEPNRPRGPSGTDEGRGPVGPRPSPCSKSPSRTVSERQLALVVADHRAQARARDGADQAALHAVALAAGRDADRGARHRADDRAVGAALRALPATLRRARVVGARRRVGAAATAA